MSIFSHHHSSSTPTYKFHARIIQRQHDIVGMLVDTLKSAVKEKVIRVCLSALRNMLDKAFDHVMLPMVGHKVGRVCVCVCRAKFMTMTRLSAGYGL